MNRERQKIVDDYAAHAVKAASRNTLTTALAKDMGQGIQRLIAVEQMSIQRMQPHREKTATAANINKAERVVSTLEDALAYLDEGELEALANSLTSLAGTAAPRRREPEFEEDAEALEVWPEDVRISAGLPSEDLHLKTYGLYKEWEREQDEKYKLRNPLFQEWLRESGHTREYDYLNGSRAGAASLAGRSNRTEDYF